MALCLCMGSKLFFFEILNFEFSVYTCLPDSHMGGLRLRCFFIFFTFSAAPDCRTLVCDAGSESMNHKHACVERHFAFMMIHDS